MTKAEIISFVWNNLQKVDKTNKYHRVVIEKAITIAFNQGYTDIFDREPRLLDNYTVTYGTTGTPITTALNSDGSTIYEATLPVEYVPFNDKASGVRHVFTLAKSSTKFYPMTKYELDIADNTLTGEIDDRLGYVVRPTVIEFHGMTGAVSVRMDIVQPFDVYLSGDAVMIPFGKDAQLLTAVIEILRTILPVDLQDNNADNG
ncbi:hypothetical protein LCGC14_1335480 [marine sediment metagenome]|uniref:Uncharacterized protein n=1 Tax=marine sediment metagenome TaxID=412755 RepID=A0A0F9NHS7_9ZZZZ